MPKIIDRPCDTWTNRHAAAGRSACGPIEAGRRPSGRVVALGAQRVAPQQPPARQDAAAPEAELLIRLERVLHWQILGRCAFLSQGANQMGRNRSATQGTASSISAEWTGNVQARTEEQVGRNRQDFGSSGEMAAL